MTQPPNAALFPPPRACADGRGGCGWVRSRFAAVHVLRQLAMDSPTHFYVQVIRDVDIKDSFLEVMWTVLCDKSEARAHLSCPPNRRNHSTHDLRRIAGDPADDGERAKQMMEELAAFDIAMKEQRSETRSCNSD